MKPTTPPALVTNNFESYKAFDNLELEDAGTILPGAPNSIWQIICHLNYWFEKQLQGLQNNQYNLGLQDHNSWLASPSPKNKEELIEQLSKLINHLREAIAYSRSLTYGDPDLSEKLLVIQDLSNHLSFHVGEVVLIRRISKTYPLASEMSGFLE